MEEIPSPQGIVLDPTEKYPFVAVIHGPAVWRERIRSDGAIDKASIFQRLPSGYSKTDSLAVDINGGVCSVP